MCLTFVQFFRNLSLCDKARVAFNQSQVKGLAGSPSESDKKKKEYEEEIDEHLFFYVCTALLKISNRVRERGILKGSGLLFGGGSERRFMYHAYSNLFALGTTQP